VIEEQLLAALDGDGGHLRGGTELREVKWDWQSR
jgi:hypothetical protein